jgi:hypothetical protein
MPREIKFRGKRVDNGEFAYGYYYSCDEMPRRGEIGHFIRCGLNEEYQVIPETVGQFTGPYDKNGKETYEGDFLFDGEQTWVVEYVQTMCGFHARDINARSSNIFSLYHLCNRHNQGREVEVISNIYDNPPLNKVSPC